MPRFTDEILEDLFTYHPPTEEQIAQYKAIREAGLTFAKVIRDNTPQSADQATAIRKCREAAKDANSAIATNGKG